MMSLQPFPLPLPSTNPLGEYPHTINTAHRASFKRGIDKRDRFRSKRCCIICGSNHNVHRTMIIPKQELNHDTWEQLIQRSYVPKTAASPLKEPRNGIKLCDRHHEGFKSLQWFIRFLPSVRKFIFVNWSREESEVPFHGKAVLLDIDDPFVPFPAVFLVHEIRVRVRWPFFEDAKDIPQVTEWVDWLKSAVDANGTIDRGNARTSKESEAYKDEEYGTGD